MRKTNGITLVALVITIIILLILSGITINLTLGENGLLSRAQESKNAHEQGIKNDMEFMNNAYSYMEQYFNTNKQDIDLNDTTPPEVSHTTKIKENNYEIPIPPEGQIYTDIESKKVPIPAGFKYKEGTKNTGLVITDSSNINEFVWVPVPYTITENGNIQEKTKAIITITAIDNESGIKSIENITTENIKNVGLAEYEVTENGEYIFRVTNNAGKYTDYTIIISNIIETGNSAMAILQEGSNQDYQGVLYDFEGTTATTREIATIGNETGFREPDIASFHDKDIENLNIINNILGTNYTTKEEFKIALQRDFNNMITSVNKYNGFYIGRYEMSIDISNQKAYSRVGVIPATAASDSANTWYGLYAYQKKMAEANGFTSVESYMMWRK